MLFHRLVTHSILRGDVELDARADGGRACGFFDGNGDTRDGGGIIGANGADAELEGLITGAIAIDTDDCDF